MNERYIRVDEIIPAYDAIRSWGQMLICKDCGSIAANAAIHDKWHDKVVADL